MKTRDISKWLKEYAEFIVYGVILAAIMVWQAVLYTQSMKLYQDLIITAFSLQILNIILAVTVAKRMRLLAQLLLLVAMLFGAVIIYYLKVLILNVV